MNTHVSYSMIAWVASAHKGKSPEVDYGLRATTTPGKVLGFFGALGDVAFAYAGHNVVLEIHHVRNIQHLTSISGSPLHT
jgi:hypothetical protein